MFHACAKILMLDQVVVEHGQVSEGLVQHAENASGARSSRLAAIGWMNI